MILYTLGTSPVILSINKSIIDFLSALPKDEDVTVYASATKDSVRLSQDIKSAGAVRNWAIFEITSKDKARVLDRILNLFKGIEFATIQTDKTIKVAMNLKQSLGKSAYKSLMETFARQFELNIKPRFMQVDYGIKFPKGSKILNIYPGVVFDTQLIDLNHASSLALSATKFTKRLVNFLKSENGQAMLKKPKEKESFIDSLAINQLDHMIDRTSVGHVLECIPDSDDLYVERLDMYRKHPEMKTIVKPISSYLNQSINNNALNLAQQLLANLPSDVTPSAEFGLDEAGALIETLYPPYLLDQEGTDINNMVIYNPQEGVWTSNRDLLYSLLTAIRPYSTDSQFQTFIATFAAKARNANRLIRPYSGSRYVLFKNGVLDVKTMALYPLSDPIVAKLHFTRRSKLEIDYVENPAMPVFEHDLVAEHDASFVNSYDFDDKDSVIGKQWAWTPYNFLMAYGNNTQATYEYFLFGISLGLFGGHNFGVHFDIKGGSRWGKTQIYMMLDNLHGHRSINIAFPNLNNQFPFTSYDSDTAMIWLDEANENQEPLDDNHGTLLYDRLADPQVRFQVKGKGDIIVNNPPQVYISGTGFIKARDLFTGPAGRTLAYKLVPSTPTLRAQSYSGDIDARLRDERVLQWVVYHAILAYRKFVPENRLDNFRMNLASHNDLALLPDEALAWRKEFVIGGDLIDDWFANQVEPYISHDPAKPTLLHKRVLYEIYLSNYQLNNPQDPYGRNAKTPNDVMTRLEALFISQEDKFDYTAEIGSKESGRRQARKLVAKPDSMNFNWQKFDADFSRPISLSPDGYERLQLFGKKASGWFTLAIKER